MRLHLPLSLTIAVISISSSAALAASIIIDNGAALENSNILETAEVINGSLTNKTGALIYTANVSGSGYLHNYGYIANLYSSGGTLYNYEGGELDVANVSGGKLYNYDTIRLANVSGGEFSNSSRTDVAIVSGGTIENKNEGSIGSADVSGNGWLINNNGCRIDSAKLSGSGWIQNKGVIENVDVSGGVLHNENFGMIKDVDVIGGTLFNEYGGSIKAATVAGGTLYNNPGGTIDTAYVASGLLNNAGVISGLTTVSNGTVCGGGSFNGGLELKYHATLRVADSSMAPVHQTIGGSGLALSGNNTITLILDGAQRATDSVAGAGTYSSINTTAFIWEGGTLTVDVLINATLNELNASLVISETPLSVADSLNLDLRLSDPYYDTNLFWDEDSNTLVLRVVRRNPDSPDVTRAASHLVNTLWSSTHQIDSFARASLTQLDMPREGCYQFWVMGLGNFMSMSSTSDINGFDYNGGGYGAGAAGGVCQITKRLSAGVGFGQTFGTFKSNDGYATVDQDGVMGSIYSQYILQINDNHSVDCSGYFSYGSVENDADTRVYGIRQGSAGWRDDVFAFGLQAKWNIMLNKRHILSPFMGINYLYGDQGDFSENFVGGTHGYTNGSMQVWSVPVGVTWQTRVNLTAKQYLLPEISVAYVGDIARNNPKADIYAYGRMARAYGSNPGRNAFVLNAGTNYSITDHWSAGAFYTLETRSRQTNQTASLIARYSF